MVGRIGAGSCPQAASGQAIKAFCAERKIRIYQFYAWRCRFKASIRCQQKPGGFLELCFPIRMKRTPQSESIWETASGLKVSKGFIHLASVLNTRGRDVISWRHPIWII
ncbi:IS66 family insertion sequence element accessory protein TnpA [Desulfatiglans anilini]|uniref:IS66 family insertion sequence element accessory protein TnpA n=1 Tax=Desulfatiglans anilini TaxID=90728 RepID=UPI003EB99B00